MGEMLLEGCRVGGGICMYVVDGAEGEKNDSDALRE